MFVSFAKRQVAVQTIEVVARRRWPAAHQRFWPTMMAAMPSDRVKELKRLLDRLVAEAGPEGEPLPQDQAVLDEAVRNFTAGGPDLLDQATPHMWAYYRATADEFDPQQRKDYGIPELAASADIWDEVEFHFPPALALGGGRFEPGPSYISFEGNVSWEPEHGLQLVVEHGLRVCKVGPYDGHHTNAHAYADTAFLDVVFR